jgi:exopolysaccharide biosynthesis polyprenyl glycosylphosphotransferase
MFQQQVQIINFILMLMDALCVILAGYFSFYTRMFIAKGRFTMESYSFVASVLVIMVVNNYTMGTFNLYSDKKNLFYSNLAAPIFKAVVTSFFVLSSLIVLFRDFFILEDYSRGFLIAYGISCFFLLLIQRIVSHMYINRSSKNIFSLHSILIVGNKERGQIIHNLLANQLSWGHKVVGRVSIEEETCQDGNCIGSINELSEILRTKNIDEVVFALNGDRSLNLHGYLQICRRMGVLVRILPSLWDKDDGSISVERCQTVPFLTIKTDNLNATGQLYKRIMDICGGFIGTILLVFIYPIIGLIIKLDSAGPIIYKQKRVGQHGRIFYAFKFRSMCQDADVRKKELIEKNEMNGLMFKLKDDPRITRVGKWLRIFSLDEWPQFINVLKGEMSLVGTRPPTPDEVKDYSPEHLKRLSAKPGITGLWQVSGRNEIKDFEQVVKLDCQYLDSWKISDDFKILFKTLYVVVKRRGAL